MVMVPLGLLGRGWRAGGERSGSMDGWVGKWVGG